MQVPAGRTGEPELDDFARFGAGAGVGGRSVIGPIAISAMASVLPIGPKATPFAKTGGLPILLGAAAPRSRLGWDATLVMPGIGMSTPASVGYVPITLGDYTAADALRGPDARYRARVIFVDVPGALSPRRAVPLEVGGIIRQRAPVWIPARAGAGTCRARRREGLPTSSTRTIPAGGACARLSEKPFFARIRCFGSPPTVLTIHNLGVHRARSTPSGCPVSTLPRELLGVDGDGVLGQDQLGRAASETRRSSRPSAKPTRAKFRRLSSASSIR